MFCQSHICNFLTQYRHRRNTAQNAKMEQKTEYNSQIADSANCFALEQAQTLNTGGTNHQQAEFDQDIYKSSEGDYDELGKQRQKVNKTDNEDEYHHAYFGEQTEDNVYNVANSNGRSQDDASGYGELGNDYHVNDGGYGKFKIQTENAENYYDHC